MTDDTENIPISEGGGRGFIMEGDPSLDVIEFDEKLLEKWFEIPPAQPLEIEIPRVTFDMLYDAIYRALQAQVDIIGALQNLATGESYSVGGFNSEVLPSIVAGMNSLRRFQMVAMSQATGLQLDTDLKVVEKGGQNGN